MENKTRSQITNIERVLRNEKLLKQQRETLAAFDRFNEQEAGCSIRTRAAYLQSLGNLAVHVKKAFESMTKEDLQNYISEAAKKYSEGTMAMRKAHTKRFFTWLEWLKVNKRKPDEEKVDLRSVNPPYSVRWIKLRFQENKLEFSDLPTEEELLKIVSCVDKQRDRALFLTLYETGASPLEILNMRVKDVAFNQYGGIVSFPRYTSHKTKEVNVLKTPYRYRTVPIASAVPDLQLWISMHAKKDDPEAPLWLSRVGGKLSYYEFHRKFRLAIAKAGIKKHLTPYSFRHARLTQLSNVLSLTELKQVAGHSKASQMLERRYVHVNDKALQQKIWRERGVEVKEEEQQQTSLAVKVCPRCKHQNSPAFKFCAMCSMPLDTETMFETQKQAELLHQGSIYTMDHNSEYMKLFEAFMALQRKNPQLVKQLNQNFWQSVAIELLKEAAKP